MYVDHVAIMRKRGNLLDKIVLGKKTIESRWYVNKIAPWNKIKAGDTIYFKESSEDVTARATVSKVLQYELTSQITKNIIKKYGNLIDPGTSKEDFIKWGKEKKKRYCILMFLSNVKKIKPFSIDKTGYGISSAWMCVGDINSVTK